MIRAFFIYTAIIEALTGIGLLLMPAIVSRILLGAELRGHLDIILAMVAGAAIFSIGLLSWLSGRNLNIKWSVPPLLLYNFLISLILLYAVLGLGFAGIPIWLIIIFHLFQSLVCIALLRKQSGLI
jgi:hypothetical protein